VPRYRFDEFILSPRRRVLLRAGREQPLIPRYFDLLVFLIERRRDAVHRRDIFDGVWRDTNGDGVWEQLESMTVPKQRSLCFPVGRDEKQTNCHYLGTCS